MKNHKPELRYTTSPIALGRMGMLDILKAWKKRKDDR